MIEIGWHSAGVFFAVLALASLAGIGIASRARWLRPEIISGLPLAIGCALAPFLLGLATVLVLVALPGASHRAHFWSVMTLLMPLAALGAVSASTDLRTHIASARMYWPALLAPLAVTGLLLFITLFTPLTQNDALEYAIIVERMFELRSLASYPMLHPELEPSGFFAPWTHPPLFPGLLYFAKLINPLTEMPGLERLIGPWALILCGFLTASLARLCGFRSAGIAFLAMLTPPLAFLGAANGLIDALTMLGFAIPMCLAAAGVRSGERLAVLTGLGIGAGVWAHSQSVVLFLLVPAVILFRDRFVSHHFRWKSVLLTLGAALAVGVWPYLWNILHFGVPVSDDQALKAMLQENWAGYFQMDRGLGTWPAKITYGLLKMFTAPEAYGAIFFLALPVAIKAMWKAFVLRARTPRSGTMAPGPVIALVPVAFVGAYLVGVFGTILAGHVTLIKNERYFLIVLPAAAVLAAGFPSFVQGLARDLRNGPAAASLLKLTAGFMIVLFLAQAGYLTRYAFDRNLIFNQKFGQPLEATLRDRGEFALSYYLRDNTPAQSVVLTLKAADMFYAKRRMLSHLDPRLAALYAAPTARIARDELTKFGVSFVHVPSYAMPTFYDSPLKQILADPQMASLRFENSDGQIYELVSSQRQIIKSVEAGPGEWPWEQAQGIVFGSRKRMGRLTGRFSPVEGTELKSDSLRNRAFARHFSATYRMGKDGMPVFAQTVPGGEVIARMHLSGRCHFMIHVLEQPPEGKAATEPRLVATAIVEPRTSPMDLPIRFKSNSNGVALSLTASGDCVINLKDVELLMLSPDKAPAAGSSN